MEFGVLLTSHPNPKEEPYPHRGVHQRTTEEVIEAERLGYDTAWIAEHHFSTGYGIMPDCFAYMAYLAAKTSRIKLAAGVITLALFGVYFPRGHLGDWSVAEDATVSVTI